MMLSGPLGPIRYTAAEFTSQQIQDPDAASYGILDAPLPGALDAYLAQNNIRSVFPPVRGD